MLQNELAGWICADIILSMVVCEDHFADPDTVYLFDDNPRVFGWRNPPCNAEDSLRAGLIVIEAWFRGY